MLLKCMRSRSWQDIENAIPVGTGISSVTGGFGPTIDNTVVFSDYPTRCLVGNFIKKPFLIGNNDYEVGLFKVIFALQNVTFTESVWDYLQLVLYACPAAYRALAQVTFGVPTWRYRWYGDFRDLKLTINPSSGAWHGSEVPVIFGTDLDIQNVVARTPQQEAIGKYVRGAWAAFAKDPPGGLTKYGFPPYNVLSASVSRLAYNNQTGTNAVLPAQFDATCPPASALAEALIALGAI